MAKTAKNRSYDGIIFWPFFDVFFVDVIFGPLFLAFCQVLPPKMNSFLDDFWPKMVIFGVPNSSTTYIHQFTAMGSYGIDMVTPKMGHFWGHFLDPF